MITSLLFAGLFLGFLSLAALCDLADLRIPNRLTAAMAMTGPVALVLFGPGLSALPAALLTGAVVLGLGWAMFERGWLGGGDAKLAAAASIWLGPQATLAFVLATALFGALLATMLLVFSRWDTARALVGGRWRARLESDAISVPYAVAMAPGGAVALSALLMT